MKTKKRTTLILLSLAFAVVALSALAITVAALGSTTSAQSNMFSPTENITARLSEPNWEAAEGIKLVPGKTVKKDPMVTNTSEIDEYVAIRLTFIHENGSVMDSATATELLKWLEIDWSNQWVLIDGALEPNVNHPLVFYYTEIVSPGQTSIPLFNEVYVCNKYDTPALSEEALDFLVGLGQFKIKVEGAAIQTQSFASAADAGRALSGLFPA
ncbi:MAG: hypothetical protein FWG24_02500 [Eggerthellaceae bacterium]|jgi:hypothetical protein|nr:hypothetical protein [Eggerthellaceae bacterium]